MFQFTTLLGLALLLFLRPGAALGNTLNWHWEWNPATYIANPREEIVLTATIFNESSSDRNLTVNDLGGFVFTGHLFQYYEIHLEDAINLYGLFLNNELPPGQSRSITYGTLVPYPQLESWVEGLGQEVVFTGSPWITEEALGGKISQKSLTVIVEPRGAVPSNDPTTLTLLSASLLGLTVIRLATKGVFGKALI